MLPKSLVGEVPPNTTQALTDDEVPYLQSRYRIKQKMSSEQLADPNNVGVRNPGIVYVLTNPAMPDYVKVGRTSGNEPKDVLDRMGQLDSTGVPRAFKCEYAAVVAEHEQTEQMLLTAFGENRVRQGREFLEGIPSLQGDSRAQTRCFKGRHSRPRGYA